MKLFRLFIAIGGATAQQIVLDAASFGHQEQISPNRHAIPHWHVSGTTPLQMLSDKVILTPAHPGNQRGALWTDNVIASPEWDAEISFRASGPDHASGSLQVWYTKQGQSEIGQNSIYTAENFEGLVVVVDTQAGKGAVRGFLNDGTKNFKTASHLEGMAFGHCETSYRNLGRPMTLKLAQDSRGFQVDVDGKLCFRSDEVLLPANNYLGITAASSETPDTFEVYKFITHMPTSPGSANAQKAAQPAQPGQATHQQSPHAQAAAPGSADAGHPVGVDGISGRSLEQLSEILRRLDTQNQALTTLAQDFARKEGELRARVDELKSILASSEQVNGIGRRLTQLETNLGGIRKDMGDRDYSGHFSELSNSMNARHEAILEYLPEKMHSVLSSRGPNLKLFIILVLLFQVALAGSYIVYKRRRSSAPKKYL